MRHKILVGVLLTIFLAFAVTAGATDLRGRVDGFNPYTRMMGPLPGVGVTLFAQMQNGGYSLVSQAITGPDGMYYFRGVYPGPYFLQIAGANYPLGVGNMPLQDIPIIVR